MRIYANTSAAYQARGVPTIPLIGKRPIVDNWSQYQDQSVPPEMHRYWCEVYGDSNIGLVLGEKSGICAIDIDIEDEAHVQEVIKALPFSPWHRKGSKGMVLAYRNHPQLRTFRLTHLVNNKRSGLVEFLSSGTQIVLPPSIHPDTNQPYESAGVDLMQVINDLREVPIDIEQRLRSVLEGLGYNLRSSSSRTIVTEWVSVGNRDCQMISVAGLFASGVMRGELTFMEAAERMRAWYATQVEQVAGDDVDIDKGISKLAEFVRSDATGRGARPLPNDWDRGMPDDVRQKLNLQFDKDNVQWSYAQVREWLAQRQREIRQDNWVGTVPANDISYALEKVGQIGERDQDEIEEDGLFQFIRNRISKDYTLSTMRKVVKQARRGPIEGTNHTEIAQRVLEESDRYGKLVYEDGQFWRWSGSHWQATAPMELLKIIAERHGTLQAARRASDHNGIMRIMETLASGSLQEGEQISGVNFANGFLTIDGDLYDHDPSQGQTYTLPYRYLPEEANNCPMWLTYLYRTWGHCPDYEERVAALQEAICATLLGIGPMVQRAICLYGMGDSGKSQMLKVVQGLVPKEVQSAVKPEELRGEYSRAALHNKLLNVAGELSETDWISGQQFKEVIDGTTMNARNPHGKVFTYEPRAIHWFASNYYPRSRDISDGFIRRWLIFDFDRVVPVEEREFNFGEKLLAEEQEAIAAWALSARTRIVSQQGFTLPASSIEAAEVMAEQNDPIRFFIRRGGSISIISPEDQQDMEKAGVEVPTTSLSVLFARYLMFHAEVKMPGKAVPLHQFKVRLNKLGQRFGFRQSVSGRGDGTGAQEACYIGIHATAQGASNVVGIDQAMGE